MVMRLHHQLRPQQPRTRIVHAPDANAWTEIPVALSPLRGQRIRWHVGLWDNLRIHWRMIGRRRFGAVGLWSLPYALLFEAAGPLLQAAGMVLVFVLVGLHAINWPYAVSLFVVMLLVGQLQTAGAILIEEVGFRRYTVRDLMVLAGWGLVELSGTAAERGLASLGDRARPARPAAGLGHDPARRRVHRDAGNRARRRRPCHASCEPGS